MLCVDDEPLFGKQLCAWLERQGYRASHAVTPEEGLSAAERDAPALIHLDWNLGGSLTGLEACREFRNLCPNGAIVIVTGRAETGDLIAALDAGIDDYVTKPFDLDILEPRVRAVLRRRQQAETSRPPGLESHSTVWEWGRLKVFPFEHRAVVGPTEARLTATELAVLARLMGAEGGMASNEEIWRDFGETGSPRLENIRAHVHTLRRKLKALGVNIRTMRGEGYALEPKGAAKAPPTVKKK